MRSHGYCGFAVHSQVHLMLYAFFPFSGFVIIVVVVRERKTLKFICELLRGKMSQRSLIIVLIRRMQAIPQFFYVRISISCIEERIRNIWEIIIKWENK